MHNILMTRGHINNVERFINELSTRYMKFNFFNKDTQKSEERIIQMRVSPIQLWDISFPKEHREIVLNTIYQGGKGEPINPYLNKFVWGLRKSMGLRKMGDYDKKAWLSMLPPENIEMINIGEKDDKWLNSKGETCEESDPDAKMEGI